MAIALATGSGQSTNVPTQTPVMPVVGGYKLLAMTPNESKFAYTSAPIDQPNVVRHGYQDIADVFKNSGVDPKEGQRVDGFSFVSQVMEVWKVEDAANTSFVPYYLPASAHLVIKAPKDSLVTSTVVANLVLRLFGSLWGTAANTLVQSIDPILRGSTLLHS